MKKPVLYILIIALVIGCREPYNAPLNSPPTGYLVVEGFINASAGTTTITLTRSTRLYDSVDLVYEINADVRVEGQNNESYPLFQRTAGVYEGSLPALNPTEKYRLHITTNKGTEYASDYSDVRSTPDIDSISWVRSDDGVQTYINTHDAANNTKYYQWRYEETWEFHSNYLSSLVYVYNSSGTPIGVDYRDETHTVDTSVYKCWKTVTSTDIRIGSSEKLSVDKIYLPLVHIDDASEQLSQLYSINLKQYALSHEAYLFYDKIKKNTEQLGSLFDAQPSELQGNIHCITNPTETVVGFVEVSEEKQKRIFISNKQVPDWGYIQPCTLYTIDNNADSISKHATGLTPTIPLTFRGLTILTFYAADQRCIDCTLRGTNKKPDFWP